MKIGREFGPQVCPPLMYMVEGNIPFIFLLLSQEQKQGREACCATIHRVGNSQTEQSARTCVWANTHTCTYFEIKTHFAALKVRTSSDKSDVRRVASQPITPSPTAAAKLLQSCPTLCKPIDSSPPGSPITGFLQARTLE